MEPRPKIILQLSPLDKALEITSYIILILLWLSTGLVYFKLPDIIPIHYNASGVPNNFGSKTNLLILPVIGSLLFWGLTALNKHPHLFNYASSITAANAEQQYTYATRILRFAKSAIVIIFTLIVLFTYFTAIGKTRGPGLWFLPFILCLTLAPTTYYIVKGLRTK